LAISVAPKPSAFNAATSAASIDASWEDGRGGAKAEAADGGYSRSEGKGVYKGRLVDERAAAQCQIDKSFLKAESVLWLFNSPRSVALRLGGEEKGRMRTIGRARDVVNTTWDQRAGICFYLNRL
jgi:hypothetical protein